MIRDMPKNIKVALLVFAVLIVISVISAVYTMVNRGGKIEVNIDAVPSDAQITFNGTTVRTGMAYLTPGKYTVQAIKGGFADFTQEIEISDQNQLVTILLTPESAEAKEWVKQNQSKYFDAEGRAGQTAADSGQAFRDKNPIVNVLPYSNLIYTIGYRADPSDPSGNSIIITIDAAEGYRNAAIEQIRSLGYDPTDFKINFKNYENPFEP